MANPLTPTTVRRSVSDSSKRKYGNKWEPVYNKKVNIKKLENLLENALLAGDTTVKLGEQTLTLHELEDIIREKQPKNYKTHPLLSMKDEDIIPWYYEDVDLSLVYKDQDNKKYYADDIVVLSTFPELKYTFSKTTNKKPFTQVMHEFTVVDESLTEHKLPYTLYIQNAPANRVFVNSKLNGQIDVFTNNISYLYVGERKHDASSNNDVVSFITSKPKIVDKTFTYTGSDATYIGFQNVDGTKQITYFGKLNEKLTLNPNDKCKITLKNNVGTSESYLCEVWNVNSLDFIPALSEGKEGPNKNLHITHSKIAVTTGVTNSIKEKTQTTVAIDPYTSKLEYFTYTYKDKYKDWTKHSHLLQGKVEFIEHPIYPMFRHITSRENTNHEYYCGYMSSAYTINLCNTLKQTGRQISYSIDGKVKDYVFDRTDLETAEKITVDPYSYAYLCTNGDLSLLRNIKLPKLSTSVTISDDEHIENTTYYKLAETNFDLPTKIRLSLKYGRHICDNLPITISSKFKNPLNDDYLDDSPNLEFDTVVNVRSNPILSCSCEINKNTDEKSIYISVKKLQKIVGGENVDKYPITMNGIGAIERDSKTVCMNSEKFNVDENRFVQYTNEGTNIELLAFGFSYEISGSGIVDNNLVNNKTFTEMYNIDSETTRYSYLISDDGTNITRPSINSLEAPDVTVEYFGKNAVLTVNSDEFTIWNNELTSINATGDSVDSAYFVKNSMCVVPSTKNTVVFTYLHKGNVNNKSYIGTLEIPIETQTCTSTKIWSTYEYDLSPEIGTINQWKYTYDVYEDNHVDYRDIILNDTGGSYRKRAHLKYVNTTDLVSKLVPSKIIVSLYSAYSEGTISEGFKLLDKSEQQIFRDNGIALKTIALLEPVSLNPKSKDIYLPALTDFYYLTDPVSGTETTYPIFREQYFLCEEYVDDYVATGKYYLYCTFGTSNGPDSRCDVLPPFIFKLNEFNTLNKNIWWRSDYETYINSSKEIKTFNLLRPDDAVSSYVLCGFSKDVISSLPRSNSMAESIHKDNEVVGTYFTNDDVNITYVTTTYTLDVNKKLCSINSTTSYLLRGTSYDYIDTYSGMYYPTEKEFNIQYIIQTNHTPKNLSVCAYVKTEFKNENNEILNPIFRLDKNIYGSLCNATDYIIYPELIRDYVTYSFTEPDAQ